MAIKGVNLTSSEIIELSFDSAKGTPDATVFTIGTLDSRVIGRIRDNNSRLSLDRGEDELTTSVNANEMNFQWVMFGLRGWDRFFDDAGKLIPFSTSETTIGGRVYTVASSECLRNLDSESIREIADKIQGRNTMNKAEEKNFAS